MRLLRRIGTEVRAITLREAVREIKRGFQENDLLTFASSIAFQALYTIIPLTLFGLGLLGGLGLDEQWTDEWAVDARKAMSAPAFQVVDDTVQRVLGGQQHFWMLAGAALAIWKVSAGMRALMDVFDRIYGSSRERSIGERLRVSLLLGGAIAALLLASVASVVLGDEALRAAGVEIGFVLWLRWPVALALLLSVVALLVAHAPADRHSAQWIGFGSAVVVAAWAGSSLMFALYLRSVADYGSIFGALATVVVALTYLYIASTAVLVGAQLDALVRERVNSEASQRAPGREPQAAAAA